MEVISGISGISGIKSGIDPARRRQEEKQNKIPVDLLEKKPEGNGTENNDRFREILYGNRGQERR